MDLSNFSFKKIAIIVGFLLVAAVIGYFIFALFFKATVAPITQTTTTPGANNGLPQADTGTQTPTEQTEGQLPGVSGTTTTPNTQTPAGAAEDAAADLGVSAFKPAVNANGDIQYYNQSDSRFYRLDASGKPVAMSDKQFFGADNVIWAPQNDKAIIEFPDGSKVRYNFSTQEQVTLPKHWEDFAFSPNGDQIVAKSIGVDPENRWLVIANDDGSSAKKIEDLGENAGDVISSWSPNNQSIAMYAKGVDYDRKEVYFIGQNGENFKSIITEGRGFQPKWSPAGHELLYSVYSSSNDFKPSLWLVNAEGDTIGANRRPLELNTWADKCTFGGSSLYCAVPQSLDRGAGLFPSLANNTPDKLYRINPSTGAKEIINLGTNSYNMKNLSVSADGTYLFFTDTLTNRLRKIKLK